MKKIKHPVQVTVLLCLLCCMAAFTACQREGITERNHTDTEEAAVFVGLVFPFFTAGNSAGTYDCGRGNTGYLFTETSPEDYSEYCALLEKGGCEQLSSNKIGNNSFAVYRYGESTLYTSYTDYLGAVRVIDDRSNPQPICGEVEELYEKLTETSVSQLIMNYFSGDFGMCYIITLEDGRFVIIDSGFDAGDDKTGRTRDHIYNYLIENNIRPDGIRIAAWILTHDHPDHYNAIHGFASVYSDDVTVERFMMNLRPDSDYEKNFWEEDRACFNSDMAVHHLHTGETFSFCGVYFEVLYTHEELYPVLYGDAINESSLLIKMTVSGQAVMWSADIEERASDHICAMYGDYLKSDICQIAHHGYNGPAATTEYYDFVDPDVILWPHSVDCMREWSSSEVNRYLLSKLHVKEVLIADYTVKTLKFPYHVGESSQIIAFMLPGMKSVKPTYGYGSSSVISY